MDIPYVVTPNVEGWCFVDAEGNVVKAGPSPAEETTGHGVSVEQMQRAIDKLGPEGGWAVAEDASAEETSGG